MSHVHVVEVRYEWTRTYKVVGGEESDAEAHAVELAKEDIQDEIEQAPPSASEFEVFIV